MKLDCASCSARYSIDESIVPPQGAKIKCRKCGAVISIPPRVEPAPVVTTLVPPSPQHAPSPQHVPPPVAAPSSVPSNSATAPTPAPAASGFSFFSSSDAPAAPPQASAAPPARAVAPSPVAPSPPPPPRPAAPPSPPSPPQAVSLENAPPAVAASIPAGLSEEEKKKHEKARRLARVLASDIAIYNREKKERGLNDGNLVAVLGYEIKKSWEIYKERVGTDFANATPYFRDALNDLLAEGKKIF